MTDAETCWRWLNYIGIALLIAAAFFVAFPGFDLQASRLFGSLEQGFPAESRPAFQIVRSLIWLFSDGIVALALAALVLNLLAPRLRFVETRVLAFSVTAYALGPGLLVNGLLKAHSGRPRPRDIAEFGGHAVYTPPFDLTGQCTGNCSFVSGETSAIATVAVTLMLVLVPCLPAAWRAGARSALLVVAACGALLRVAFGAHFPSDVVFAAPGMAALVILLYLTFGIHRLQYPFVYRRERLGLHVAKVEAAQA